MLFINAIKSDLLIQQGLGSINDHFSKQAMEHFF